MIAAARRCADDNRSQTLRTAALLVQAGFNGNPPDWRLYAELSEEVVARTRVRPYESFGARIWEGVLQSLAHDFEDGDPQIGHPQDFERAWRYQSEIVERVSKEPGVAPEVVAHARERLAQITAKRDLARARSGRWTGDISALSKINWLSVKDDDVGAAHMRASGYAAVIRFVDYYGPEEYDEYPDPNYNFNMAVYTRQPLGAEHKGLCLILSNADIADPGRQKIGIWYEHLGKPPFRETRGAYTGWFKLRLVDGTSFRPIEWPLGTAARTLGFEFRPASSPALCPERL